MTIAEWIVKFRARYNSFFSSVADETLQVYLEDALLEVDEESWGELYERGVCSLTCHMMTLAGLAVDPVTNAVISGGNVTSLSDGSVSVGFSDPVTGGYNERWYTQTPCGTDYLRMMNIVAYGIVVIPVS